MNVYDMRPVADGYEQLSLYNPREVCSDTELTKLLEPFNRVLGIPISKEWVPLRVYLISEMEGQPLYPTDYFSLASTNCFNSKAIQCLEDLLTSNGELLPLISDDGDFFLFNTTRRVDALDPEKSVFGFRETRPEKPVFYPDIVKELSIFDLSGKYSRHGIMVYVTDIFVDRVRECGLRGFVFHKVWSSDE